MIFASESGRPPTAESDYVNSAPLKELTFDVDELFPGNFSSVLTRIKLPIVVFVASFEWQNFPFLGVSTPDW